MTKLAILAALAGLTLAVPAYASETPDDAASTADATAKPKEKMVCQRITDMGSRASRKVCQTEAQWRAEREAAKRGVSERDRDDR
jgi:hypothetical protein